MPGGTVPPDPWILLEDLVSKLERCLPLDLVGAQAAVSEHRAILEQREAELSDTKPL